MNLDRDRATFPASDRMTVTPSVARPERTQSMSTLQEQIVPPPGLTPGEPVWDIARLFPAQGQWSESEYLQLSTNHLVEFTDGFIEFLPMPTRTHQRILKLLLRLLDDFVQSAALGLVLFAGY